MYIIYKSGKQTTNILFTCVSFR